LPTIPAVDADDIFENQDGENKNGEQDTDRFKDAIQDGEQEEDHFEDTLQDGEPSEGDLSDGTPPNWSLGHRQQAHVFTARYMLFYMSNDEQYTFGIVADGSDDNMLSRCG
jgi:hypothetical protein